MALIETVLCNYSRVLNKMIFNVAKGAIKLFYWYCSPHINQREFFFFFFTCFDRNKLSFYFILPLTEVLSSKKSLAYGLLHKTSCTRAKTFCNFRMFSVPVAVHL